MQKRITLFKELVPSLTRLGMFGFDVSIKPSLLEREFAAGTKVSSALGFEAREYGLKTIDDFEPALAAAMRDGIDGIYLSGDPLIINNLARAAPLILGAGKPTVGTYIQFARAGVLMTYASDPVDGVRRAGIYAARIVQGAKPGELPIEQPTKFVLAINAKTADQLGISVPPALLAQADEVIEWVVAAAGVRKSRLQRHRILNTSHRMVRAWREPIPTATMRLSQSYGPFAGLEE